MTQPPPVARNPAHKTRLKSRRLGYFFRLARDRRTGFRTAPILATFPGAETQAGLPPVRIFIGTEPAQARAARVLVWSILVARDPARDYEISLMSDLAGYGRRYWKTGFTNYRYAIPFLAEGAGRAIYNDVDQIYLADPATLFDQPMAGAGAMSPDGRDTSVMLLDCARIGPAWPAAPARSPKPQHAFYRAARDVADLWGPLDPAWNARDEAYRPGATKLLHYTTLHAQPWAPFPQELRYEAHPHAGVWQAMERAADAAGFTIFTAERPSPLFRAGAALGSRLHLAPEPDVPWLLDAAFQAASGPVEIDVACYKTPEIASDPERTTLLPPAWWRGEMAAAARRNPGKPWRLVCRRRFQPPARFEGEGRPCDD